MYLKELYRHNKFWFIVVALFIVAQLVNNVRQDVSLSPIYQYGMYSEYIPPEDVYNAFEINVNGKILEPKNFTPQQWDKITLPLNYYANSKCNNDSMYYKDVKRLLQKMYITPDSSNFIYPFNKNMFMKWYQSYLSSIVKENITSLSVNYNTYQFDTSFHNIKRDSFKELCQ